YDDQGSLGTELKTLDKEVNAIGIDVVNFKSKEGSIVPIVSEFDLFHDYDGKDDEASSALSNEMEDLRRSRRRTVQPKRYVGCDVEKLEVGNFRTWPYKRPNYVIDDENSSLDSEEDDGKSDENSSKNDHLNTNDADELNLDPYSIQTTMSNDVEVDDRVSLGDFYSFGKEKLKRKRFHDSDDMDLEGKWEGIHFKKGAQTKRYHSIFTSRERVHEEQDHKGGKSLNGDACKEMIDTYMKNFDSLPTEEEPTINEET
ncbi:SNF2 domain-containing protein CLASSY 1-like, partial [Trifolium medium]|nr:SNF2 domain-containing protein CLASSY 1-like [Trifolium medium]